MKYLIIGLGIFGTNVAIDLTAIGSEVIGVDNRPEAIESIKDNVTTTYLLDTTDENSLNMLPLKNIDIAIVAIGDNFGASIKTVALLKKMGVKRLMVRAIDALHEAILEGMGVERILTPEKKSAINLATELTLNSNVTSFAVNADYYVFKFRTPDIFVGRYYSDFGQKDFYGLRLIAACRQTEKRNMIGMETTSSIIIDPTDEAFRVDKDDILTFFGSLQDFRHFFRKLSEE